MSYMVGKGLSEQWTLPVVRMSASAFHYTPRPDRSVRAHRVARAAQPSLDHHLARQVSGRELAFQEFGLIECKLLLCNGGIARYLHTATAAASANVYKRPCAAIEV